MVNLLLLAAPLLQHTKSLIVGGVVLGVLVFYEGIPFILDGRVDVAYDRGVALERVAWEEARVRQIKENQRRLKEAQQKVDKIARDLEESEAKAELAESLLENILAENNPTDNSTGLSRRLSTPLNKIGRN